MTKKKAKCSNKKKTKKFEDPYKGITLLNIDDESTKKLIFEIKLQRQKQKQNKITQNEIEKQEKTESKPQKIEEKAESSQLNEKSDFSLDSELSEEKSTQMNTFPQNDSELVEDKTFNLFDFSIIKEICQQKSFDAESSDEAIKTAIISELNKNN